MIDLIEQTNKSFFLSSNDTFGQEVSGRRAGDTEDDRKLCESLKHTDQGDSPQEVDSDRTSQIEEKPLPERGQVALKQSYFLNCSLQNMLLPIVTMLTGKCPRPPLKLSWLQQTLKSGRD